MSSLTKPHRLVILGTPAEETTGGKISLIQAGAFTKIDVVLMSHPGPEHILHGTWLALQEIRVTFRGQPAHASASPWDGVNALDAAVSAYTSISNLRQQCRPTDRVHGIIVRGGEAPNVIPSVTTMTYYIRSATSAELSTLRDRIVKCFQGAGLGTGCSVEIDMDPEFMNVVGNGVLGGVYEGEMRRMGRWMGVDLERLPRGSTGTSIMLFALVHSLTDMVRKTWEM